MQFIAPGLSETHLVFYYVRAPRLCETLIRKNNARGPNVVSLQLRAFSQRQHASLFAYAYQVLNAVDDYFYYYYYFYDYYNYYF